MTEVTEEVVLERYHPRVEANLTVRLLQEYKVTMARARDLSMAGLFLIGQPTNKDHFTLAIPLPGDREIITQCEVRRRTRGGMAVEFLKLDWEDLFALARFLHPRLP